MKNARWFSALLIIFGFLAAETAIGQEQLPYTITWTTEPGDTAYGFSGVAVNTVINSKAGLRAGFDFDSDGNMEFITSLQSSNETPDRDNNLYLFEADGDNNFSLRWSYKVENVQHQRNAIAVADLDGNEEPEIIFVVDRLTDNADNVLIFEYDPNLGNFPEQPTATWNTPRDFDGEFRCEVDFKVMDIDQDGRQEMILISFDGVIIASLASNDFSNPQFNMEYSNFAEMQWTFATAIADLDNNGTNELIAMGAYGLGALVILEALAPDFYLLSVNLTLASLPGGVGSYNAMTTADLDGNGFPEIYYSDTNGNFRSFYTNGAYNSINASNFYQLGSAGSEVLTIISDDSSFYVGTSAASQIFHIEYAGGDVGDSLNYQFTKIFEDTLADPDDITIFRIAGAIDLDGDGRQEIVLTTASHDETRPTVFVLEETMTTSVAQTSEPQIPDDFTLEQNYPNPFNPSTSISFRLPTEEQISLKIYNTRGQEVKSLIVGQTYSIGTHSMSWDARDNQGTPVASGVYIYRLSIGRTALSRTMSLIR